MARVRLLVQDTYLPTGRGTYLSRGAGLDAMRVLLDVPYTGGKHCAVIDMMTEERWRRGVGEVSTHQPRWQKPFLVIGHPCLIGGNCDKKESIFS